MKSKDVERIPGLVQELYGVVRRLEALFPGRKFTPDGHLVGSIGEVLAAHGYGLDLLPASAPLHDARSPSVKLVQVKATQGKSVGLRGEPEHLLVLKLLPDGSHEEIYAGPGSPAWEASGRMQANGQRSIGLSRLRRLMEAVPHAQRLKRRTTYESSTRKELHP